MAENCARNFETFSRKDGDIRCKEKNEISKLSPLEVTQG